MRQLNFPRVAGRARSAQNHRRVLSLYLIANFFKYFGLFSTDNADFSKNGHLD